MADFGSPVAQNVNVNPTQGIQTLSALIGLKGQQADVQSKQQSTSQRKNLAQFYQNFDFSKHVGPDGTLDLDSVLTDPALRKAAGDQFPDVIQHMIQAKQGQLTAKQQLVSLNDDTRKQFQESVGGLREDPDVKADNTSGRQKVQQAIGQFAATGPDAARVSQIYGDAFDKTPPGKLHQAISNAQLQAQAASAQAANQAPAYLNTGATQKQINPQAAGGGTSGDLTNTVAPGRQPFTDQFGQVFNFNPQTGSYESANKGGGTGTPKVGASSPGDVETVKNNVNQNFANITANRESAKGANQQIDQIDKALDLSKHVMTGNWAAERARLESGLSSVIPGLGKAQDDATKLQLLDKFSERIASDASKVLGQNASTDAARDSIHRQNANIGYTPQAIQSVLKYAKAQTMAVSDKTNAQEKWLKQQGNGITNHQDFETAWRQSYDPVLYQLQVASPDERRELISKLSAEEAASLKPKHDALVGLGALGGANGR